VSGRDGGMDEFGMQAEEWSIAPPAAIPQLVDEPNRRVSRTPYATRTEDGEVAEESRNWDARVLEATDDVMTGVVMAEFAEHGFPREFINRP